MMYDKNTFVDWVDVWKHRASSHNEANVRFPHAREEERSLLLRDLHIEEGDSILQVGTRGGYLSDSIVEQFGDKVKIMAIEPSANHSSLLSSNIQHVPEATITDFRIGDNSVERVVNLAALHHTFDNDLFFQESHRVLKSQGVLAVAEIHQGSIVDHWLNGFVDKHNSKGHQGIFFTAGELSQKMKKAGFQRAAERFAHYTWNFTDIDEMITFCTLLFGLDRATREEVHQGIQEILGYMITPVNTIRMNWVLLHAFGIK